MLRVLILALGGALGTVARYGLGELFETRFLGTMIVNITGCFVIGLLSPLTLKSESRLFWMVGFCGGYTTFSTFGLQTVDLARNSDWLRVAVNVLGSNLLGIAAVYLGWLCSRLLPGGQP